MATTIPPTYIIQGPLIPVPFTIDEIKNIFRDAYGAIYESDAFLASTFIQDILGALKYTPGIVEATKNKIHKNLQLAIIHIQHSQYMAAHNLVRDAFYMI